jgi:hypothetical protein
MSYGLGNVNQHYSTLIMPPDDSISALLFQISEQTATLRKQYIDGPYRDYISPEVLLLDLWVEAPMIMLCDPKFRPLRLATSGFSLSYLEHWKPIILTQYHS